MQDYKVTKAEKKLQHLGVLEELAKIMEITYAHYLSTQDPEVKERLHHQKETFEIYKKNNLT